MWPLILGVELPLLADSTQWGARRIAAIEKFVVSANVGFLEQGHTHPIGHEQPLGLFLHCCHSSIHYRYWHIKSQAVRIIIAYTDRWVH